MSLLKKQTSIKACLSKLLREFHKVTLDERNLSLQPSSLGVLPRSTDLEVVVIKPDDLDIRKASYLASWSANAAADVEDAHTRFEVHMVREVVFVTSELRT